MKSGGTEVSLYFSVLSLSRDVDHVTFGNRSCGSCIDFSLYVRTKYMFYIVVRGSSPTTLALGVPNALSWHACFANTLLPSST